jgi:hypothetical protein
VGNKSNKLRTINVTRYSTPLREGGSLPAIIEADDDGLYVLKFRGAAQGIKALIAELISGEIGRALGFSVPEIVLANLDIDLSKTEPDPEIQALLKASSGLNIALDFLPGSITFDPLVNTISSKLASQIVWFDSYVMNIDRTPKNPNLLMWHKNLWLIDHGASLYFHHKWESWQTAINIPFIQVSDHIMLPNASELLEVNEEFKKILSEELLSYIISLIPEGWLLTEFHNNSVDEIRNVYFVFLKQRLESSMIFVQEALHARQKLV